MQWQQSTCLDDDAQLLHFVALYDRGRALAEDLSIGDVTYGASIKGVTQRWSGFRESSRTRRRKTCCWMILARLSAGNASKRGVLGAIPELVRTTIVPPVS